MQGRSMMTSLRTSTPSTPDGGTSPVVQQQQVEMNEPVEESALRRAWIQYIETIPEEKLLITAIQNSEVQLCENTNVGVKVTSEEQMIRLNEHRGEILTYLKTQLRNTNLDMTFAIVESKGMKAAFTPRERMAEIRDLDPELIDTLVDAFGLELT